MPITFVIGRAGSGKTRRCFERIVAEMQRRPLGPRIYWLLPPQATFTAQRQLACGSGLPGFCRARILSLRQLGQDVFDECGGGATPLITDIGRQMILGRLLRELAPQLEFFGSAARQPGLAAELDRTFDELERAGKTADDLAQLIAELEHDRSHDSDARPLAAKLCDLHLLYKRYTEFLGQERLDPHRRLLQVLESIEDCAFFKTATVYLDGFLDFTDFERRMIVAIAKTGATIEITLLMDPQSPILINPNLNPDEMGLFCRTEETYRRLWFAFSQEGVTINEPVLLGQWAPPGLRSGPLPRYSGGGLGRGLVAHDTRSTQPPPQPSPGVPGEGEKDERSTWVMPSTRFTSSQLARLEREFDPRAAAPRAKKNGKAGTNAPDDWAIERIEASDRTSEVDAAARRIRSLLAGGYRQREILVLVRDLEKYQPLIDTCFDEHQISFFSDRRRKALHHPLIEFLRAALQIARFDWRQESVMALARTGLALLSADEADELENYCCRHHLRSSAWDSEVPWNYHRDLLRDPDDVASGVDPLRIDDLRRRLSDRLSPFARALQSDREMTVRQIATDIFSLFERFSIRKTISSWMDVSSADHTAARIEESGEHEQVWVRLVELFDELVELLGDQPTSLDEFVDVLESGLDCFDLAIAPATVDQVLVGQIDRTIAPPVRAVIVMGLNEGEFPAAAGDKSVLSDRERRELKQRKMELDRDSTQCVLDESLLGYLAFTRASHKLIVTRARCDDRNRQTFPSVFWHRLETLFPTVKTISLAAARGGDVQHISTARQLIGGLMQWIRRRNARPIGSNFLFAGFDDPKSAEADDAWRALYQWLAISQGQMNSALTDLLQRAWPALSYSNAATISESASRQLFHSPLEASVAQLETFATCPFRHFLRHGLGLETPAPPGVTMGDHSRIYHRALDQLVGQVLARNESDQAPLPISGQMIHAAVMRAGQTLAREMMLGVNRSRYLLSRIERTLHQFIAGQRELMNRYQFRPASNGVSFGGDADVPPLSIQTPRGNHVHLRGRIDRIDVLPDGRAAVAIDYRLSASKVSLAKAYYGLALQLLVSLLVLDELGEALFASSPSPDTPGEGWGGGYVEGAPVARTPTLTLPRRTGGADKTSPRARGRENESLQPVAAFDVPLLRSLKDVAHPDDIPDPEDPRNLLKPPPRGIFAASSIHALDSELGDGQSAAFAAFRKKDGQLGNQNKTDGAEQHEFAALLRHVRQELQKIADDILAGNVAITPYRLNDMSPCANCDYRSVCRFETSANRYHRLDSMGRVEVLKRVCEEGKS